MAEYVSKGAARRAAVVWNMPITDLPLKGPEKTWMFRLLSGLAGARPKGSRTQ